MITTPRAASNVSVVSHRNQAHRWSSLRRGELGLGATYITAAVVACGLLAMAADDCFAQSLTDRARSSWNAMQEAYPTPDALAGDPASTGLLLVEGYFTWAG